MSNSRFILWETETAVAYLISLGIAAWGICIVVGTIAAGSALAWTIAGLVTVAIGSFSFFQLFAHVKNG
jgi:hypothetical protein